MARFMIQAAYTQQAWEAMVRNPRNRTEALRPVIEKLGGRIEGFWYVLGEHDAVAIVEMPDNASAAAFSIAAAAAGAVKSFKTTPLMTAEEGVLAMKRAGEIPYLPPGR